jgi:dienelactone hydrolase
MTRRKVFQAIAAGAAAALPAGAQAQQSGRSRPDAEPAALESLNRFPQMMQEYFMGQVRRAGEASVHALDVLQTKADAEAHVRAVRAKIRRSFGPVPEKTPLNPRITGVVERDAYRVEKVIFESRPGLLVTANLYLPKGGTPRPGVVGTCGHTDSGKAGETYQSFAQGLARLGYVCLLYDPIGQGERMQYTGANAVPGVRGGTGEHNYCGAQQLLVGDFFGAWRAWDGVRALDYLLTRPEVDHRHIGVTGNSGGGTMTTWLCGVEERWTMAAPSCFVTTFRRNMENELPADMEQCPPQALALGLDHADFISAMAPKPVILLGKEKDYFDARGIEEAYARLKRLYTLLGAPDQIGLYIGPGYHGFTKENREGMYRWFNRVTGISDAKSEPDLVLEKEETLRCTPSGQVADMGSKPVFAFTKEKSEALGKARRTLSGDALQAAVAKTLRLPARKEVPDYRILRRIASRGFPTKQFGGYVVQTEPGIQAIVYRLSEADLFSRPPREPKRAVLYVSHHSADAELRQEPLIREIIAQEPKAAFYTCDVRGIGESQPNATGQNTFANPYGSHYFYAAHAIMLDRPLVAQRTHDVLMVLEWLKAVGHTEVHLAAKGWGTLPAAFAALSAPGVVQVTLKNAPVSYAGVAESRVYRMPLASVIPGVLEQFDLPECYRALQSKHLRQIEPTGPNEG